MTSKIELEAMLARFMVAKKDFESLVSVIEALKAELDCKRSALEYLGLKINERFIALDLVCTARFNGDLYSFSRGHAGESWLHVQKLTELGVLEPSGEGCGYEPEEPPDAEEAQKPYCNLCGAEMNIDDTECWNRDNHE